MTSVTITVYHAHRSVLELRTCGTIPPLSYMALRCAQWELPYHTLWPWRWLGMV